MQTLLRDRTKLLAYILAILPDEHVAEDILQEVSLAAVRKLDEIDSAEHLLLWLRRAARFEALAQHRKRGNSPHMLDAQVLDALESHWKRYDAERAVDWADTLRHCLSKLTPYARKLIELRFAQGLTGEALASAINRKPQAAYIALSRARRALSDCLRREHSRDATS
ncbi:sigma-70 family RNA polymerase sigma factor [Planctomycetales bacterium ZRK34]|nr:sigma-70 family RNA polymerase sigma factor [Planctomycetales bacterium ZRK34]